MKTFARFVVLVTTLLASTTAFSTSLPIKQGKHAVEITIANSGNGIDSAFPSKVKKIIGNAIATGVVDKFVVYGYGLDSDFTGCVEERAGNALP
uniref:hypothetical protein n=1 Tax=Crenothrix polyspora TaxID=360316 RepID=UPI001C4F448F